MNRIFEVASGIFVAAFMMQLSLGGFFMTLKRHLHLPRTVESRAAYK
jgi:hypothetical protein